MPNSVYLYLYLCGLAVSLMVYMYNVHVQSVCIVQHCLVFMGCIVLSVRFYSNTVYPCLSLLDYRVQPVSCIILGVYMSVYLLNFVCLSVSLCYICCLSVSLHYTVHGVCQFVIYSKYMVFVCQFALYIWYISVYQLKLYLASICYGL